MSTLYKLPKPFFILAPMDDVTDTVFRQIVATLPYPSHVDGVQGVNEKRANRTSSTVSESRKQTTQQSATSTRGLAHSFGKQAGAMRRYGPDLYFTEFVNVDGLQSPGRPKLLHKLALGTQEGLARAARRSGRVSSSVSKQATAPRSPIVGQIWGKDPINFYKTTKDIIKMGFDGVDINMGCPEKSVIKNGCCIALVNNRPLARQIIKEVKRAAGPNFPVSVKTRLGLIEVDYSWHEFLLKQKINMLTIHGRTAAQMSKVPADWEAIAKVRQLRDKIAPGTLVAGNGDVKTLAQGIKLAAEHKLDGIMIGRGIFDDPFAFAIDSPWADYSREQKIALYKKHVELFAETWINKERKVYTLNKFCKIYVQGFDGAKELREQLMAARDTEELLNLLSVDYRPKS